MAMKNKTTESSKNEGSVEKRQKLKNKGILKNKITKKSKKTSHEIEDINNSEGKKKIKKKVKLVLNDPSEETVKKANNAVLKKKTVPPPQAQFHEMGIDDRVLEGIAQMRWKSPTLVQEKAIPFMLSGKNVVAQARTGSGKTGAFLVPCIHRTLRAKALDQEQAVRVLVLAPSKELCRQIGEMAEKLANGCRREVRVLDLSSQVPLEHQRPLLAELPDIVVGPPGRVLSHVLAGNLSLSSVKSVVVDEADLMMAYQHSASLEQLWQHMPDTFQIFVTSATLSKDMKRINQILLKDSEELMLNTVVLKLKDPPLPSATQLSQFVIKIDEFEKTVLLCALYRLRMINGKTIIFVNSVNKGYKLRIFLGQFGISSCLLNAELPATSRCHIIEQFNTGLYTTIIATDDGKNAPDKRAKYDTDKVETDAESGTSRGLDFQFVCNIINFDFPTDVTSYVHRVGRTARGYNQGTALSMVSSAENELFARVSNSLDDMMLGAAGKTKGRSIDGGVVKNYAFDMEQLDGFRYRAQDVWRMCTKRVVIATRKKEIKQQLLKCKTLEGYFRDNPNDRNLLRHDKEAHGLRSQRHLRNLPDYIIPDKLRASAGIIGGGVLDESTDLSTDKKFKSHKGRGSDKTRVNKKKMAKNNPLKKLNFAGFKKK